MAEFYAEKEKSTEDEYKPYKKYALDLKEKMGYNDDQEETKGEAEMVGVTVGEDAGAKEEKKNVDFDMEVGEVLNMQPWKQSELVTNLLKAEEDKFNKYNKFLLRSFNSIQEKE